ncbi:MAG: hypothetical protein ABEJ55_08705 [Halanaeroarchaeum sp.]
MALHAIDDLTDAFDATKAFLLPFDLGRWLRLAVISLFVASSSGWGSGMAPSNPAQFSAGPGTPTTGPAPGDVGGQIAHFVATNLLAIVAVLLVLFALGLILAWLASVFEFAFLASISREEVHVRSYVAEFSGPGTRLFGFRVVFGLLVAAVFGGGALLTLGPALLTGDPSLALFFVLVLPLFVVLGALASVVYVFTTAFVAPIMLLEDRGVISGWRRFWGVLRANWKQFGTFAVVGVFVMIGVGIVAGIAAGLLGVAVAIPFALVFFALVLAGIGGGAALIAGVLLGIPLLAVLLVVMGFVQVPIQTYLRYWALLVLGDVDADLDLIPDQRAAIRE